MVLIDRDLMNYKETLIKPFSEDKVSNICYDLTADSFSFKENEIVNDVTLKPMDSVMVMSKEEINLPDDIYANVILRNSRIRQGLTLEAPVYQPGHHTKVFYRIINTSGSNIELRTGDGIAAIQFHKSNCSVAKPYNGTFQNEFNYSGMGAYKDILSYQENKIEDKENKLKDLEKTMYSTILAMMAVFVAIFSIINVNIQMAYGSLELKLIIILDLVLTGSIGFLISMINTFLLDGKYKKISWGISTALFIAAIIVYLI